jgi:hypothetical protein
MQNTDPTPWDKRLSEQDDLDRALDAALAKYAAVEPRAGLEQRVLAQLQSESTRLPKYTWWQWSVAGAIAVVLAFTFALAWRWNRPAKTVGQQYPSAPIEIVQPSATQVAANGEIEAVRQRHKTTRQHVQQPSAFADGPKLDQFPSPRPLSEQEKLALEYVERFPEEASLMAQAETNFVRQQEKEEMQVQTNVQ